ncbi:hypothetical protein PV08_03039 [Exophiala spinifera]|uniref:Uncharacterized protein n=1 Tax=Exophiala spinifera TaxID=91928 RepID=A0A0D2BJG7_9EURO|nr:uncharacterized protein PV08_03039 [Exophiala spinifera]KIW18750.1 hypothetical protein PV08_03039 [Exophiala spinifera]
MWSTVASWAALIAVAAALTRHYNPELFNKLTRRTTARSEPIETSQRPASKRQRTKRHQVGRLEPTDSGTATPSSGPEDKANKRRKVTSTPLETHASQRGAVEPATEEDNGMSNKEFARQLAKAQAGTKLEPAKAQGPSKKERRAARKASTTKQNGVHSIPTESTVENGDETDDDAVLETEPSSSSVSMDAPNEFGDVSDMLEAPTAKPTSLRLTNVKDAVAKNVTKPIAKAFEPVLSKKQRQRQAKKAEEKARMDESNRLQEAKKQNQLRTARMAEGSSNQTKANSFTARQNAWQQGKPSLSTEPSYKAPQAEAAPLLDTFNNSNEPATHVNGAVTSEPLSDLTNSVPETATVNTVRQDVGQSKTAALGASGREKVERPRLGTQSSWADEVNEEEQDKWATDLAAEEQWESVTSKKGKKKATEKSSSPARPAATVHNLTTTASKENGVQSRKENANRFQSFGQSAEASFKDADWEA